MLNFFRKNTKTVIWSVIVVFLLWGGFSVGTQFREEGRYAGQVFGKNISFQEFDQFYKANQLFNSSDEEQKDPDLMRESAWQGVIFSREARHLKINVSDDEVRDQIFKILDQQKMNRDNYENWLKRSLRLSPQQFEEMLRETLRIRKLLSRFEPTETALSMTTEEVQNAYYTETNQMMTEFIRFTDRKEADIFRDKLKTPEDWKKEKEKNPSAFQSTGKMVSVILFTRFLQLNPADTVSVQVLEKNHFSGVLASGKDFTVLYVTDKVSGDEKDFEAKKKTLTETLKDRKRQSLLVEKTSEIVERARLIDYTKQAAEPIPS